MRHRAGVFLLRTRPGYCPLWLCPAPHATPTHSLAVSGMPRFLLRKTRTMPQIRCRCCSTPQMRAGTSTPATVPLNTSVASLCSPARRAARRTSVLQPRAMQRAGFGLLCSQSSNVARGAAYLRRRDSRKPCRCGERETRSPAAITRSCAAFPSPASPCRLILAAPSLRAGAMLLLRNVIL